MFPCHLVKETNHVLFNQEFGATPVCTHLLDECWVGCTARVFRCRGVSLMAFEGLAGLSGGCASGAADSVGADRDGQVPGRRKGRVPAQSACAMPAGRHWRNAGGDYGLGLHGGLCARAAARPDLGLPDLLAVRGPRLAGGVSEVQMKNRLKVLRAERDWSQADLAERLEVSRQSVNAIETGKFDPSLPLAFKLARLFEMTIEEIFE